MAKIWAVDIGQDYTKIAVADELGRTSVKSASDQGRCEPSAIAYDKELARWYYGASAIGKPEWEIRNAKQLIARSQEVTIGGFAYPWLNLVQRYLSRLWTSDEQAVPEPPDVCAFVLPWTFASTSRHALLAAAKVAGIKKAMIVNEGEAAIIGYQLHERMEVDREYRVLVADFGASGLRFSVLKVRLIPNRLYMRFVTSIAYGDEAQEGMAATLGELSRSIGQTTPAGWQPVWHLPDLPAQILNILAPAERGSAPADDAFAVTVRRHFEKRLLTADRAIGRMLDEANLGRGSIDFVLCAGGGTSLRSFAYDLLAPYGPVIALPKGKGCRDVCAHGAARLAYDECQTDALGYDRHQFPFIGVHLDDDSFDPILSTSNNSGATERRYYQAPDDVRNRLDVVLREGFAERAIATRRIPDGQMSPGLRSDLRLMKLTLQLRSAEVLFATLSHCDADSDEALQFQEKKLVLSS